MIKNPPSLITPIGILGGTFDPIHNGHLTIAASVLQKLPVERIKFIPCYEPVHRPPPQASAAHRAKMIQLALNDYPHCEMDCREIDRKGPSYTIDTLLSLRQEYKDTPICLILGADAYLGITSWHRWQELMTLAHFIVIGRPSFLIPEHCVLSEHHTRYPTDLTLATAGAIYFLEIPPITISATAIRLAIKDQHEITEWVPPQVIDYIQQHQLYSQTCQNHGSCGHAAGRRNKK